MEYKKGGMVSGSDMLPIKPHTCDYVIPNFLAEKYEDILEQINRFNNESPALDSADDDVL